MKSFSCTCVVFAALFMVHAVLAAEAPTYKDGDRWKIVWERNIRHSADSDQMPTGSYDVFYNGGNFLWCPSAADAPLTQKPCNDPWKGLREEDAIAFFGRFADVPFLAFPMNVGDTRTYKYKRVMAKRSRREKTIELTGTVRIEAVEKINGMDAFKHVMHETDGFFVREYTYFYAPASRSIVDMTATFGSGSGFNLKMTSFELAK